MQMANYIIYECNLVNEITSANDYVLNNLQNKSVYNRNTDMEHKISTVFLVIEAVFY